MLLVYVWMANSNWREITDQAELRRVAGSMEDVYIELLDPFGARVLGSTKYSLSRLMNGETPSSFFHGTRLGYRVVQDSLGERTIHLIRYRLVHR
jgi:hypothetical protein